MLIYIAAYVNQSRTGDFRFSTIYWMYGMNKLL